jgi:hypothetical protein
MSMSISSFGTPCSGAYTHKSALLLLRVFSPTALRVSVSLLVGLPAVPIYYYYVHPSPAWWQLINGNVMETYGDPNPRP